MKQGRKVKVFLFSVCAIMLCVLTFTGCRITINLDRQNEQEDLTGIYEATPGLVYILKDNGTYSVTAPEGFSAREVNVPADYNGRAVTEINANGFAGCETIETVNISKGVNDIGVNAFANCSLLNTVNLPRTLQYVGDYAFSDCTSLKEMVFPDEMLIIGFGALKGCNALRSLTVPFIGVNEDDSSEKYLGYLFEAEDYDNQFKFVPASLETVAVTRETVLPAYSFYNCQYIKSVTLPETLEKIGWGAFYNCVSIEEITVPEGTTHIGNGSFGNCTSLKTLNLPNTITNIENNAFNKCQALSCINYKGTLEEWEKISIKFNFLECAVGLVLRCTNGSATFEN